MPQATLFAPDAPALPAAPPRVAAVALNDGYGERIVECRSWIAACQLFREWRRACPSWGVRMVL
jgi:hypothetical protein